MVVRFASLISAAMRAGAWASNAATESRANVIQAAARAQQVFKNIFMGITE
jgi:hypothetical protein